MHPNTKFEIAKVTDVSESETTCTSFNGRMIVSDAEPDSMSTNWDHSKLATCTSFNDIDNGCMIASDVEPDSMSTSWEHSKLASESSD